jgi:pimeloyl-ACP methyl ester carboxylesterase
MQHDTLQLHWDVHDGDGPYLLLVHGFLMSRAQWRNNLVALARFCRPVVVELWGHGRSPAPEDTALYRPDSYVEAFEAIRAELGVERWWLCGYSLGAGLTIRYALEYPNRVYGHAFTNSTSAFADVEQTNAWQRGASAAAESIVAGGIAAIERMPVHPRHTKRLAHDLYAALMEDAARLRPTGIANTLRYTNPNATVRGRVHANVRPALLVCGSAESRFAKHREFAQTEMPGLSIVDLAVGHGVNMEDAAGFNRAIGEFVTSRR